MRRYVVPLIMLGGIAWLTSGPSAQGLGNVARREAERRQQVSSGKKYTNEDLQPVSVAAPAPPAAPESAATPAKGSAASAGTGEAKEGAAPAAADATSNPAATRVKSAAEKRGEDYWRGKAGTVQAQLDKATARVDGLTTRLENLEAQLKSGAGSSHVQEREVTLKALEKAQNDARWMREEWDRLEARAQSEKVPSEWLR